jgi:hypothetical protein
MRIEADSVLRHRRDAVFEAYRDDLGLLAGQLPNVRRVELVGRTEDGPIVRLDKVWHGAVELPANLSGLLEQRFLSWDDHAVWDRSTFACDWVIEPHVLREAVRCHGRTEFIDLDGERTRIELTGELTIDLEKVRVPSFLAGSLARTAERFLVRTVLANLESVSDALDAYLRADTVSG